jgi:hypothetical protein
MSVYWLAQSYAWYFCCVVGFQCLLPLVCFYSSNIYMWESDGPTYKLMSRVRILLLVPCYFNETDSGSVKILIFLVLFFSLYIFFISFPKPLHPLDMSAYSLFHPLAHITSPFLHPSVLCYLTDLLVSLFAVFSLISRASSLVNIYNMHIVGSRRPPLWYSGHGSCLLAPEVLRSIPGATKFSA